MNFFSLIIDRPEENLDNQTIATILVPAINHAKQYLQIVIVTHNPNLAVVCDAEQIIHSRLDKTAGHRVVYTTGAIENPVITQLIVDVLEELSQRLICEMRGMKFSIVLCEWTQRIRRLMTPRSFGV